MRDTKRKASKKRETGKGLFEPKPRVARVLSAWKPHQPPSIPCRRHFTSNDCIHPSIVSIVSKHGELAYSSHASGVVVDWDRYCEYCASRKWFFFTIDSNSDLANLSYSGIRIRSCLDGSRSFICVGHAQCQCQNSRGLLLGCALGHRALHWLDCGRCYSDCTEYRRYGTFLPI